MSQPITITSKDILHQVKLSCKFSEIVEGIIKRKVIATAAAEVGIKVETEELQKAADQIRFMNSLYSAKDTMIWLEKHGLSLDDFEEIVYINLISVKLAACLFADKVEPYFFEHQLDYAAVAIYEVVLDDEDLAIELFYEIGEGEISFTQVAHQYIQDTELRRCGGYRGIVRRNSLKPEISAAVFAAQPPKLLNPIVTSSEVHLILVEEIIQPQLDDKLHYQIMSDLFVQWLKRQIEEVEIVTSFDFNSQAA